MQTALFCILFVGYFCVPLGTRASFVIIIIIIVIIIIIISSSSSSSSSNSSIGFLLMSKLLLSAYFMCMCLTPSMLELIL
jgi:hypothetical protein